VQFRRRREDDALDGFAGTLGDGIERADFLERVAEEIQPVRLVGGDGIEVHNTAAHGVLAGCLAHRLAVVVKRADQIEQALERAVLAAHQFHLPGREIRQGRHGLEQGGGGREHQQGFLEAGCPHPAGGIFAG